MDIKSTFFAFMIVGSASSFKVQSQNSFTPCELPSIAYEAFDSIGCTKVVEKTNRTITTTQIDTITFAKSNLSFSLDNFILQHGVEKNHAQSLIFHNKSTNVFVFFHENNMIRRIIYYDSCTVQETNFDIIGVISSQFECDYDKPNRCYSRNFSGGKLLYETHYVPLKFSEIKDVSKLNRHSQEKKAVPIKTVYFDENRNILYEKLIEPFSPYDK